MLVAGGFGSGGRISSTEIYVKAAPIHLIIPATLPAGTFQFGFTDLPGMSFSALATTSISQPLSNWNTLGSVTEVSPGQFQFTDPQATSSSQRFYRVQAN